MWGQKYEIILNNGAFLAQKMQKRVQILPKALFLPVFRGRFAQNSLRVTREMRNILEVYEVRDLAERLGGVVEQRHQFERRIELDPLRSG